MLEIQAQRIGHQLQNGWGGSGKLMRPGMKTACMLEFKRLQTYELKQGDFKSERVYFMSSASRSSPLLIHHISWTLSALIPRHASNCVAVSSVHNLQRSVRALFRCTRCIHTFSQLLPSQQGALNKVGSRQSCPKQLRGDMHRDRMSYTSFQARISLVWKFPYGILPRQTS